MADFEYAFASSLTPNSFAIGKSGITGIDEVGGLTPKIIRLAPSCVLLMTAAYTDAELVTLMTRFCERYGSVRAGGGGYPTQASLQEEPALTEVDAAD